MSKKKENLSLEERLQKAIIPKEEEPYRVPDNWIWTSWGEVTDIFSSKRVLQKDWKKEGIPFYRTREIVALAKDESFSNELFISKEHYNSLSKETRLPKAGDLMVTGIGTIGVCYLVKERDCFYYKDASVLCVSKKIDISSEYLKYLMRSPFMVSQIKKNSAGTTVDSLTINKYKTYKLPLPPLEEQKRIVEKLDSLFEKTQKIKDIIEEVKEKTILRREAILSKVFTGELTEKWRSENKTSSARELLYKINDEKIRVWQEECEKAEEEGRKKPSKPQIKNILEMLVKEDEIPYKVPDNWIWTRLSEITEKNQYGYTSKSEKSGEIKYLRITDIQDNKVNWKNVPYCSIEEKDLEKFKLKENDIVVTRTGATTGKSFLIENINCEAVFASYLIRIRIINGLSKFLWNYMKTNLYWRQITEFSSGIAQPGVNAQKLENLLIPLPPLEEQKEIVRILNEFFEKENKIDELLKLEESIEVLESSILDKAFKGELGTQNKDDYPILERLKEIL